MTTLRDIPAVASRGLRQRSEKPGKRGVRHALLGCALLASGLLASAGLVTPGGGKQAAGITVTVPGCVVDPADMLGWWKGEDDLLAEVGPDLVGSVGFADALVGRGMSFDETSLVGVDGFPTTTEEVTVEAWIKPEPSDQTQALVSRWTFVGGEGDDAYALWLTGSDLVWLTDEHTLRRPVEVRVPAPQLFDGAFHHVAATWSATEIALYIDGAPVATKPSPGGLLNDGAGTPLRMGSSAGPGSPLLLTGVLDEPTIYSRALTPAEIDEIDAAGPNAKCPAPPSVQQAKLVASDAAAGDNGGRSVAVDGDTAVVGAPLDDNRGAAYVYTRSGTTWTQQAKLLAADGASSDDFGFDVAISGDTVVVGAYEHDVPGGGGTVLNSGAAYVFTRSGTTWTQQAKLVADVPAIVDNFGRSVAISGDTVLVGVLFDDDLGGNSGSAYVFTRSGTTWTQQAKLLAADGAAGDGFGFSVALDGDTGVIGSDLDDDAGSASGSAYVFTRSGTTWTQQAKLLAADGADDDHFGTSVAISGGTALVGAYLDDDLGGNSGSAYVFTRSGTTWTQQAKLLAADGVADDQFGTSVTAGGDTVVIGSDLDDDAGSASGSAYVFTRSGTTWTQQAKLVAADAAAEDRFGRSVAISGGTAVIGAYLDDDAGSASGSAYVFTPAS